MIYSVKGELVHLDARTAVISCGGVGFRCYITMNTARQLPSVGQEVMLYTILNVREDAIELFGFADQSELACFKQLTSISGVGPKAANAVLSELSPEKVALAVASGDYRAFTRASGVGPKLAQRIALEMKDKVGSFTGDGDAAPIGAPSVSGNAEEAVRALSVLGFNVSEASAAVGKLDSSLPVEQLVRAALKALGGR